MSIAKTIIPLSFIHKVNIARIATGITPENKNGAMVLTSKTDAGIAGGPTVIDATDRVVTYTAKEDFANEWDSTCPVYDAVCKEFDGGASPVSVGFYDAAADITAELQEIVNCQPNFYTVTTPDLIDDPLQVDVGVFFDKFDPDYFYVANTAVSDPTDPAGIYPAMAAAGLCTTALFYHDGGCDLASEFSGFISTFDLDASKPPNIFSYPATGNCPPANLDGGQSELTAMLDANINTKVCVGNDADNTPVWLRGRTIKGGRINDCVLACWLKARAQEALFNFDIANGAPDYTRFGYFAKINAASSIYRIAQERGLISGDRFNEDEARDAGYRVVAPAYEDIPAGSFTDGTPFCITIETYSPGAQEGSCLETKLFL